MVQKSTPVRMTMYLNIYQRFTQPITLRCHWVNRVKGQEKDFPMESSTVRINQTVDTSWSQFNICLKLFPLGAEWYAVTGGMQDYNYIFHGTMELTLEISCCKHPLASTLEQHWQENRKVMVEYINQKKGKANPNNRKNVLLILGFDVVHVGSAKRSQRIRHCRRERWAIGRSSIADQRSRKQRVQHN